MLTNHKRIKHLASRSIMKLGISHKTPESDNQDEKK